MARFELTSRYAPAGGQPEAIERLVKGASKHPLQTLLGITGSGKTFVIAHAIERIGKPTLVLAHNKTLAAQLYAELRELFPQNRVEYFISYYDYYQPESYLPTSDTYIEKEATVNAEIEKMRLRATAALMSRDDVIIVASISCIYGLGNPADYYALSLALKKGGSVGRSAIIDQLVEMQYQRSTTLEPGQFRVRGDVIDVHPPYDDRLVRIELFGDEIERLSERDTVTGETISQPSEVKLFAAKHFVTPEQKMRTAIADIRAELDAWAPKLDELERQRLTKRVEHDIEMLEEMGYCTGIENYSRHFDGRKPGTPPYVLLDYFPDDFLLVIDESHATLPQARGMYRGDYSRKKNLVDYGFRLPCAYDNRPLTFDEFRARWRNVIFTSATPGGFEREHSGQTVELIIRPTGLLDPRVETRPAKGQIADLVRECRSTIAKGDRVLITTLTKRMAEDLTHHLSQQELRVRYLHSEIESLDRIELIRQLRAGEFDILVGINLLREGLDIPEVALVAILDADREGYLRNETSLIQTIGRAARNDHGRVILYAERESEAMRNAMRITRERRAAQQRFNAEHHITPRTIEKPVPTKTREVRGVKHLSPTDLKKKVIEVEAEMRRAAERLEFERAIELRDTLAALRAQMKE